MRVITHTLAATKPGRSTYMSRSSYKPHWGGEMGMNTAENEFKPNQVCFNQMFVIYVSHPKEQLCASKYMFHDY